MREPEPPGSPVETGQQDYGSRPPAWVARNRPSAGTGDGPLDGETTGERVPPFAAGRRQSREPDRENVGSFIKELPLLVLVAFGLAFLLRTFVVQVFYIPSSSMEPTLMVNDRILVDKVTYRMRDLRRGEIVVFEGEQFSIPDRGRGPVRTVIHGIGQLVGVAPANARDYVKRVIGLPGDRIRIDSDGTVYVNDQPLQEPYVVASDPRAYGPITVPPGRLFFLGDNRPNSSDSRFENLGFVPQDHVVGKAFVTIWPPGRAHFLRSPVYAGLASPAAASHELPMALPMGPAGPIGLVPRPPPALEVTVVAEVTDRMGGALDDATSEPATLTPLAADSGGPIADEPPGWATRRSPARIA